MLYLKMLSLFFTGMVLLPHSQMIAELIYMQLEKADDVETVKNNVSEEKDISGDCVENRDLLESLDAFRIMAEEKNSPWIEYAYVVKGGKKDYSSVIRLSALNEQKSFSLELWFDRLGDSAFRLVNINGEFVYEMKQNKKVIDVQTNEAKHEESYLKNLCEAKKKIDQTLKKSISSSSEIILIKTDMGEFKSRKVQLISPVGSITLYISKDIPLTHVVRMEFSNGDSFDVVASGKNAYSVFTGNLSKGSIERMMGTLEKVKSDLESQPTSIFESVKTDQSNRKPEKVRTSDENL